MASLKGAFSGGFNGRVGNLVGYQWRGKWCVRSVPSQYRDAKTEYQLAQRALFKATVGFAAKARRVLRLGLHTASLNANMTENNYFMRINKGCFAIADGQLAVDYESLLLSEGPVAPVAFGAPRLLDDTTVSIDFEQNPLRRAVKSGDEVYLVAYCPELQTFDVSAPSQRYRSNVELQMRSYWTGKEIHLWGFVVDKAGRASTSQYIGNGVLSMEEWVVEEVQDEDDTALRCYTPRPSFDCHTQIGSTRSTGACTSLREGMADAQQGHPPL